jgi:hypothetical protein
LVVVCIDASPSFTGDANEKFVRLAQEYNKIKTQNAVLKKAVLQVSYQYNNITHE